MPLHFAVPAAGEQHDQPLITGKSEFFEKLGAVHGRADDAGQRVTHVSGRDATRFEEIFLEGKDA